MHPGDDSTPTEDSNRRRIQRAFEIDRSDSTRDVATANIRRTIEVIGEDRFEELDSDLDLEDFD